MQFDPNYIKNSKIKIENKKKRKKKTKNTIMVNFMKIREEKK